jgi:glycosyltransferase involved in cell wall biosynthesis
MLIHGAVDNDLYPPRFGGTQRAFGLFRGLARRSEVRVLCLVPNRTAAPREETVAGVTLLRRKAWYTSAAWRLDRAGLAPLQAAAELHTLRARALLAALPGRPDVLAAEFSMAGLLDHPHARLGVYLSQNVEADFFATTSARLAFGGLWRARVRERERRAVERAGLTVVVSEEDAARMVALHGADPARLDVIPNGYDETGIHPPTATERERARAALGLKGGDYVALFVGSDVAHNRDGVRLLLERVGPRLRDRGVVVVIAGSVSRAVPAPREPWLRVLGEVGDLASVLHAADAGLNPVLRGGGSNVKLPTYLAAGLAVVSTGFGTRGYARLAPLAVTAETESFADAISARPRGWLARGEAMPAAVADHAWGTLGERLGERLAARLAGAGETPAAKDAAQDAATRAAAGARSDSHSTGAR